jgi:(p)ppGpp synthase/HD superfamily hydrolase
MTNYCSKSTVGNLWRNESHVHYAMQLTHAAELVKARIQGTRKGSLEPAFEHSWRVSITLEQHGFAADVVLAGMLHDVVEDGETSLNELEQLGCNQTVLGLVDLASHNMNLPARTAQEKDRRWAKMVSRLEQANNPDAWAIKMSDLLDNLRGSRSLPPERQAVFLEVKAPTYLRLTNGLLGQHPLWREVLLTWAEFGEEKYRGLL